MSKTIKITKKDGSTEEIRGFDNRALHLGLRQDRKEVSISHDDSHEDLVVHEKKVDGSFRPSTKETEERLSMSDVESYEITHTHDGPAVTTGKSSGTPYRKEVYEKSKYIDKFGIERTTFKKVKEETEY